MTTRKAPRRTAERILENTLALFNRFGEPGVSTNAIAAELSISPGNLYYHFPAKDDLVNTLYNQYEQALNPVLAAAGDVSNVDDAWFFLHSLVEVNWQYRFVFRNLNELLSRNRQLENSVQETIQRLTDSMRTLLLSLQRQGALAPPPVGWAPVATCLVVMLVYWLSYEYVQSPRTALEEHNAQNAALRGAAHVLGLLAPYTVPSQQAHLARLVEGYMQQGNTERSAG